MGRPLLRSLRGSGERVDRRRQSPRLNLASIFLEAPQSLIRKKFRRGWYDDIYRRGCYFSTQAARGVGYAAAIAKKVRIFHPLRPRPNRIVIQLKTGIAVVTSLDGITSRSYFSNKNKATHYLVIDKNLVRTAAQEFELANLKIVRVFCSLAADSDQMRHRGVDAPIGVAAALRKGRD